MKFYIKLICFFLLISSKLIGQSTEDKNIEMRRIAAPNCCNLYNSAEDYYNNLPIENIAWKSWESTNKKLDIVKNGVAKEIPLSEMVNKWYSDEDGFLMRTYKGQLYTVVLDGPICYYILFNYGEVRKVNSDSLTFSSSFSTGKFFAFYSETLDGEIKEWSDKILYKYLTEFVLDEQYDNYKFKREMKDSVMGYETKKINKKLKFLKIINEKLREK